MGGIRRGHGNDAGAYAYGGHVTVLVDGCNRLVRGRPNGSCGIRLGVAFDRNGQSKRFTRLDRAAALANHYRRDFRCRGYGNVLIWRFKRLFE